MSDPREVRGGEHLSSGSPQATPTGCQPLRVWLEVCAGTMAGDISMTHLQHAAECRDCSSLLAQANAALGLEPSSEEQAILNRLETSSPSGQQRLAKVLHAQTSEPLKQPAPRRFWNLFLPILSWGAAAACVLAIAAFLLLRQPSDATLLAEAYNQQRPSQLRLPGTEPGPLASPTRGSAPTSDSSQLLRLKLRTQQSFEQKPNDPSVRQTLGRIALVEHDGETARRNLEMAQALDPNLAGLNFDLASAYFELAESTGQSLDYGRAIDLYSQHLQQVHGNDPVTLYNRALCWERTAVLHEAIADLQAALALEKDPRWRQKIQSDLDGLKQASKQSSTQQPLTAALFLSSTDDPPGFYEQYLSLAGREWLPRRGTDPQIDSALHKLAILGRAHNDRWIDDMLAVPESDEERAADQTLSDALTASAAGNTDADFAASTRATELYRRLNNQPGFLRAAVEHLYALQRMGRAADCLREANALSADPQFARYVWLDVYLQLETAAAYGMLGDAHRHRLFSAAAVANANLDRLPISSLRATGFVVNDDVSLKHYESAWQHAAATLRVSEEVRGVSMPRFQLLSALRTIASDLQLSWTQAGLTEAAAATTGANINRKTAAYAFEDLGLDDLRIGDLAGAERSFRSADSLFATLGSGDAVRRYAADWHADRALLLARTDGPAAAATTLAREEPTVRQSDALLPRLHFYTEYADLLRQSNNPEASLQQILVAVIDAERSLSAVRTSADRSAWPQQTHRAYEVLVADLAEDHAHPALALRAWEWLESASFREGRPLAAAFSVGITPAQLDEILPQLPTPPPGSTTLVLAHVLDHYILWSLTTDAQQPVRQYILSADPTSIPQRATTLLRLCSDPHSSTDDLTLLGQSLYIDLLSPADDQLSETHILSLDLDPSLAAIPFPALQRRGRFIGLDYALTLLPGSWVLRPHADDPDQLPPQAQLALLQQSPLTAQPPIPGDYDESADILSLFPNTHLEHATLSREGPELALNGSPNLRTLLSHADAVHYVGHGLDEAKPLGPFEADPTLKLSAGVLPHTRLAVLAACRTLSEREDTATDVPSFARIVMAAGASHVLATQWDVDSRMTSHLMRHFYAALAKGTTFSEALRQAQQSLEADSSSAHPYFWSGFQLVGNP
jgi:CHAT domain-containing protein